jgi:hypothetical protein
MYRALFTTVALSLLLNTAALAQGPRFLWQQGQVLTYQVEHLSTATEVLGKDRSESRTRMMLTKRWEVLEVDGNGVATLQLSLTAMRWETTTPGGGTLLFDSADPSKSDGHLREELGRLVGSTLAVLRVDPQGRVLEVKESKHGPASRFESELPFVVVLPDAAPQPGQSWQRAYKVTLDPPQGTGEKYDAVQTCACKAANDAAITVALATELKTQPQSVFDRIPLLQMQPQGEVVFDLRAGRLKSAHLRIDKELAGHQGEGSSYRFQSDYTEQWIDAK